jgi:hypothetical protein
VKPLTHTTKKRKEHFMNQSEKTQPQMPLSEREAMQEVGEERLIEENAKIEQELSEEQLQVITGGCAQCTADVKQINHHLTLATAYGKISDTAAARGKDRTLYEKFLNGHADAAENLMDGLLARGHRNPLGTPPPSPIR